MKRTDAERQRADAERRPWFHRKRKATKSARRCPWVPRRPVALRPVNVRGHSAKGMRAPENTNQFLMTEKYRLHALRSDSVDSSTDSDEHELTDMDTYLGAWEDAHGALLDPEIQEREETGVRGGSQRREGRGTHAWTLLFQDNDEDSAQYFPSEDDLKLSDNFMHQDFTEFCHLVTS